MLKFASQGALIMLKCYSMRRIVFLGSTIYHRPLRPEVSKKFAALSAIAENYAVGFSTRFRFEHFDEFAHFFLLPRAGRAVLRYITVALLYVPVCAWLCLRKHCFVVVAQGPLQGVFAVVTRGLLRLAGRRIWVIIESHGDFERDLELHHRIVFPRAAAWIVRRLSSFALRRADALRAVSTSTARQMEQHAGQVPLFSFPAWSDLDQFLAQTYTYPAERMRKVVYVGSLIRLKGLHTLIEALALVRRRFPDVELEFVGAATDRQYLAELEAQIAEAGLVRAVRFTPHLAQRDLAPIVGQSLALVLPSLSEGLGRVIFEAMAAGTPVVAARVGGIPDMVKEGVNGYMFEAQDAGDLARKLESLLSDAPRAAALAVSAREFAVKFFGSYVDNYEQIFKCLERAAGSGDYAPTHV